MPKIPRLQIPDPGISPVGGPSSPAPGPGAFGAASGQALVNFGGTMMKATDVLMARAEQNEVSRLTAEFAKAQNQMAQEVDRLSREGDFNDTQLVPKTLQEFERQLENLRNGVETRAGQLFFEKESVAAKSNYERSLMAVQSEFAGLRFNEQYNTTKNELSSSLVTDPFMFEESLRKLENSLSASGLTEKEKVNYRIRDSQELAVSAIQGHFRLQSSEKGVDAVRSAIEKGKWDKYIDGKVKVRLLEEADQRKNAIRIDRERSDALSEKARKKRVDAAMDKLYQGIYTNSVSASDIINSPELAGEPGKREQLMGILRTINRPGNVPPDFPAINSLFGRINGVTEGPPVTEDEIARAFTAGKLGNDTKYLNMLRSELRGDGTERGAKEKEYKASFLRSMYKIIVKPSAYRPVNELAEKKWTEFLSDFRREFAAAKAKGISLDDLFDTKSKEYLGRGVMDGRYVSTRVEEREATRGVRAQRRAGTAPGGVPATPLVVNPDLLPGKKFKTIQEFKDSQK